MKGLTVTAAIAGSACGLTMGYVPQAAESCVSHAVGATGCAVTDTACVHEPDIAAKTHADDNLCDVKHRSAHVVVSMRPVVNISPGLRALLNNNIPRL
ncbi:hypothetical protein ACKVWC_011418 [Pyricularia oryzae]